MTLILTFSLREKELVVTTRGQLDEACMLENSLSLRERARVRVTASALPRLAIVEH